MRFSSATLLAWSMAVGVTSTTAFTWGTSSAVRSVAQRATFVSKTTVAHPSGCACPSCATSKHGSGCACPSCLSAAFHPASCVCSACGGRRATFLFADATDTAEPAASAEEPVAAAAVEEVPPSVEALDGIASEDEAHNAERPARKALAKKGPRAPRGKPLSEFEVGSMVTGKVRKIADYGAFVDFGGSTDGLLHISQLSEGYVASVKDVLAEGQEIQVRIVSIDAQKNQVGLSMMSLEQHERAQEAASSRRDQRDTPDQKSQGGERQQRQQQPRSSGPPRRDDSPVVQLLNEKGWDTNQFVEGTVVSVVEFGAFVRFDVSALNAEVQGEIDGLVHISALSTGRVQSVKSVVKVDDKVQIRLKNITGNKVSLTMVSAEDEKTKAESSGGSDRSSGGGYSSGDTGAKDWQESVERIKSTLPTYENRPLVIDLRNGSSNGISMTAEAMEIPQAAAATATAVLERDDAESASVAESE